MAWLAVAFGGAVGSLLRYAVGLLLNQSGWPFGTWLANVLGSFCIGIFFVWGKEKGGLSPDMYLLLTTGLLGGFTTYSTFSLEVVTFFLQGHVGRAVFYASFSIVLGLIAAFLGISLARQFLLQS